MEHRYSTRKKIRAAQKWYKFRWLLLLVFVIGCLATYSRLERFETDYVFLTFFALSACGLLLTHLNSSLSQKLPIWVMLGIFIFAYYIKFYLMVYNPEIVGHGFIANKTYSLLQSPTVIFKSFATFSYGFMTFCVTAWILLGFFKLPQMGSSNNSLNKNINYMAVIQVLRWLIPALMVITLSVMYITGVGRMGGEARRLPFRLAGWITHIRRTLIPGLIFLFIWFADKSDLRKGQMIGIGLLLLHGLGETILRASRGILLLQFLSLFIFFLLTRNITKKDVLLFGSIILLTIVMFPIIMSYRFIRMGDSQLSINQAFIEAIEKESLSGSSNFSDQLMEQALAVTTRLVGVDSIYHIIGANFPPLYTDVFRIKSVSRFFTVEVHGFPPDAYVGSAPSTVGWFYLVGGNGFVALGISGFTLFVWVFWHILVRAKLYSLSVAQALFLKSIFLIFQEGTLDSIFLLQMLVLAGSIAACEWLVRVFGKPVIFKERFENK